MKRAAAIPAALGLGVALGAGLAGPSDPQPAELVFRGGGVYTVDPSRSWAEAVAVRAGRIVYVGPDAGIEPWIGTGTEVIDLAGRMLLPSFQDAHLHPLDAGLELGQCDLTSTRDAREVVDRVRECATGPLSAGWLIGTGWQAPFFPEANPHRSLLDGVVGEIPTVLWAADGHSAWVSTRALELAGIEAATPDPENGRIERDADGSPSGTLRESATELVAVHLPVPSIAEGVEALRRAETVLLPYGLTAVQDARIDGERDLESYRAARQRGIWRLRTVAALEADPDRGPEQVVELVTLRDRFAAPGLDVRAVKIFVDGVIEARTAFMLEPYEDRPGDRSAPIWPAERLRVLAEALADAGFSIHFHAIGDGAVRLALDAIESAQARRGDQRVLDEIAHLEVVHPADLARFGRLGVAAGFQPLWAWADSYIRDLTWPGLGPERSAWIYPMASVARAGGPLAFGSDWSVSSPNPLLGIEVALTRCDPEARPGDRCQPMQPDERLDLAAAIAAYTLGAARANGLDAETGSIELGKAADLVVLSANLFAVEPGAISEVSAELTVLRGVVLWRSGSPG